MNWLLLWDSNSNWNWGWDYNWFRIRTKSRTRDTAMGNCPRSMRRSRMSRRMMVTINTKVGHKEHGHNMRGGVPPFYLKN